MGLGVLFSAGVSWGIDLLSTSFYKGYSSTLKEDYLRFTGKRAYHVSASRTPMYRLLLEAARKNWFHLGK
jgi:hypothetical protein